MNKIIILIAITIIILIGVFFVFNNKSKVGIIGKMDIKSSAFESNGKIPSKYTCDSDNVSPPLTISNIPEGTVGLVLIMDDPDAVKPAGKVWDHWVVINIPASTKEINEDNIPGKELMNSFNKVSYGGPCQPDGEHRYFFKVYALDITLDLDTSANKKDVEDAMNGHILAKGELIGLYERTS